MKDQNRLGIVSYGTYIPRFRMLVEEPLRIWDNTFLKVLKEQLLISERVVLSPDEDTVTMAVDATRQALERWGHGLQDVGGLYLGTCTNPYSSRPCSTIVAEALGENPSVDCLDVQFSTRSGTAALRIAQAMVLSKASQYAIAVGSDTINRHTAPGTLQEYTASAAAAAVIVGENPDEIIAEVGPFVSIVSDLSDMFRLEGERYISSGGASTIDSGLGLYSHISQAVSEYLKRYGFKPQDFHSVVFQQPSGVLPVALAKRLGFSAEQVMPGVISYKLGDFGSASTLVALSSILDHASPNQKILVASYGFGAGADVTAITVTENIRRFPRQASTVEQQIQNKVQLDYATAMKYENKFLKQI
jgi:2-acetylphloroglucinol acetyltransferase